MEGEEGGGGGFLSAGLDGSINTVESERRLQKANISEAIFTPHGAILATFCMRMREEEDKKTPGNMMSNISSNKKNNNKNNDNDECFRYVTVKRFTTSGIESDRRLVSTGLAI